MNHGPTLALLAQVPSPNTPEQQQGFLIFSVCWVILGIASFLFFYFNRNAPLKRKIFPVFVVATGFTFAAFLVYETRGEPRALSIALPMIALITFLNIRTTRFCDPCGRTLIRQPLFTRPSFCPHCGARLP